jgi:hypothetical protein
LVLVAPPRSFPGPPLLILFALKSSSLLRQNHRTFGKVEDAVKEIVAQGYLHVKKSKDRDGQPQVKRMKAATNASSNIPVLTLLFPFSQINYCLGLRGEGEVTRLRMLNWAEHVFDEKMLSSTRSVPQSMNTGRLTHPLMFDCLAWEAFSWINASIHVLLHGLGRFFISEALRQTIFNIQPMWPPTLLSWSCA